MRSWSWCILALSCSIAFDKPRVAQLLAPGLSLGILLGALVIVVSWIVTWIYVRWANNHLDRRVSESARRGSPTVTAAEVLQAPNATAIGFFVAFVALTLGITWWAARRTTTHRGVLRRRPTHHRSAERLRAGGRLHERRQLSGHRRAGVDFRDSTA